MTGFLQLTVTSAAEAFRLYFRPLQKIVELFADVDVRPSVQPFDSPEDLSARIQRLKSLDHPEFEKQLADLSQDLSEIAAKVRQMEQVLGLEQPIHPRSKGAFGD